VLQVETHDDVTRLRFSTWRSRAVGYSVSCFAVRDVVIDAAFDNVGDELLRWIRARRIAGVVVTHGHDDHAGNVELLARAGVPLQMGAATEAYLRTPQRRNWYRKWTWGGMPLLRAVPQRFQAPGLELIAASGHSHDHHVVWDAATRTLFAADLFLGVKVRVAHPVHREDVRGQVGSIRRALALRPRRVFDAHRGLLADGAGLLAAKATWMEEMIGAIDQRIDRGWPDGAIAREVLGPEPLLRYTTGNDFSHANFVASVRSTHPAARAPGAASGAGSRG
jgi:glyoxylase-like metal-dependent hydrolase (beta-lactamase superfamily II)